MRPTLNTTGALYVIATCEICLLTSHVVCHKCRNKNLCGSWWDYWWWEPLEQLPAAVLQVTEFDDEPKPHNFLIYRPNN